MSIETLDPKSTKIDELNFKIGDIITAYWKGFWRVVKIEPRWYDECDIVGYGSKRQIGEEYSPLVVAVQIFDANGVARKSKKRTCDSTYCNLASISIDRQIADLELKKEMLEKFKSAN